MPVARLYPNKRSGIDQALGDVLGITPEVAAAKPSVTVFFGQTTIAGGLVVPILETSTLNDASSTVASSSATSASSKQTSSVSPASSAKSSSVSSSSSSSSVASSSSASRSSTGSASSTARSSSLSSANTASTTQATSSDTLFSTSTAPSSTASAAANENAAVGASAKQSTLSTGAIIGIVAGGAALIIVVLIFLIRKRFLRRRQKRRATWAIDNFANIDPLGLSEKPEPAPQPAPVSRVPSFIDSVRNVPRAGTPMGQQRVSPPPQMGQQYAPYPNMQRPMQPPQAQMRAAPPPTTAFVPLPNAPPTTYNNPPPPVPNAPYHPAALTLVAPNPANGAFALVRTSFVPRMNDELSVNAGEMVRIIEEFDDGWARCTNLRGEAGVVPLECLQRQGPGGANAPAGYAQAQMADQGQGDWRALQRSGSLRAGQNGWP